MTVEVQLVYFTLILASIVNCINYWLDLDLDNLYFTLIFVSIAMALIIR